MPTFLYSKNYRMIENFIVEQCQNLGRERLVYILTHRRRRLLFSAHLIRVLHTQQHHVQIHLGLNQHTLTVDVKLGSPDHRSTGYGRIFSWKLDELFP